ncbi:MAG: sensor histidine kinase, partial [Microbacterium sp.]|nr:sensor histidine kinase [Microbacterium sp.]
MRFRTIAVTLLLTSLAIFITCVAMALVIQNDLFESRKDDALAKAQRAVAQAQTTLDNSNVDDDRAALQALWRSVQTDLARAAASDIITASPIETVSSGFIPPEFRAGGLSVDMISDGLRKRVA